MIDYTKWGHTDSDPDIAEAEEARKALAKTAFLKAFATVFPEDQASDDTLEAIVGVADALAGANEDIADSDLNERQAGITRAYAVISRALDALALDALDAAKTKDAPGSDAALIAEVAELKAKNYRLTATLRGVKSVLQQSGAYIDLVYQARSIIKNSLTDVGDEA